MTADYDELIPRQRGEYHGDVTVRVSLADTGESEYLADRLHDHGISVRVAPASPEDPFRTGEIVIRQELSSGLVLGGRDVSGRPPSPPADGSGRLAPLDLDAVARRIVTNIHRAVDRDRRGLQDLPLEDEDVFNDIVAQQSTDRRLRPGREGTLVCLRVSELARIKERIGGQATATLAELVRVVVVRELRLARPPTVRASGELVWVTAAQQTGRLRRQLERLTAVLAAEPFTVAVGDTDEHLRVTPAVGYVAVGRDDPIELLRRASAAAATATTRLDLEPCAWEPSDAEHLPADPQETAAPVRRPTVRDVAAAVRGRVVGLATSTGAQAVLTFALALGVPYLYYVLTAHLGLNVLGPAYAFIVLALVLTAGSIYVEGLLALDPVRPPRAPDGPPPPATAIIAAYLPNESATVVDTLEAFLRLDYDGPLQIILAYNTPRPLPVEATLQAMAAAHPQLVLLNVAGSTSKAQNVNAALEIATGRFTGIFDADHHPAAGSMTRAWRWIGGGYGIVQGHCVIRNGGASWLSRLVAVEFESIYAVSHPGRAKLHGFGIFGGSNGYWRTDVLRRVRMRQRMLTEDIDSSLRAALSGVRIASDPALLSYELAPTTLGALTRQRLRWAQGWFQVSRKYLGTALASPTLGPRQKAGLAFLLGWREIYPWVSLQIFPLMVFQILHPVAGHHLHWAMPFFLFLTLMTMGVGAAQSLFGYLLAHPDVRRHRAWFLVYALVAGFAYTEYKNTLARVAQVKELWGERQWRVTPRQVQAPAAVPTSEAA